MTDNKMTHFECVGEFHDTFGHPQKTTSYTTCFVDEPNLVPFRISLMKEELNEFMEAYTNKDLVEMADALCDLSYVTNGTGHCLGINLDKNLRDLRLNIDTPYNLDTKVNRNIFSEDPDMISNGFHEIGKMLEEFCVAYDMKVFENMEIYLTKLLYVIYKYGHLLNFNMDKMFREVHDSNMTKVCNNINDAEESISRYKHEARYDEPTYRVKGLYYVVYDAKTSKILKNYKWTMPNLKQFM